MKKFILNDNVQKILASLTAILIGFIFGFLILLFAASIKTQATNPIEGFITIITGGMRYNGIKGFGIILRYTTPVLLTGLSVGFAFKTGLFNIGAAGQFVMGGFTAAYIAIRWTFIPLELLWIVALLGAVVVGGIWGMISGVLKAYRNVNEVISSIMLNYIGMITVSNLVFTIKDRFNPSRSQVPLSRIPTFGLDKLFGVNTEDFGIFIAIAVAIVIYIVLEKTSFGYELKACGFNREAARYAGINDKKGIILSMTIAGALSGLGGALVYVSSITKVFDQSLVLQREGFDGISVALLGLSNPLGIIFSSFFISMLRNAGSSLSRAGFNDEVIRIMTSTIIYASAFSLLFRDKIHKLFSKKEVK